MIVSTEKWQDIPLLHIYEAGMVKDTPIVIFLHGFTSAKEHNLHYAYQLVKSGVRVIMPDAHLHGERESDLSKQQMEFEFWKIVLKSVAEVDVLYRSFEQQQLQPRKIGLAGTSMGGIVTSGCLCLYDWIDTAAICMGVTSYTNFAQHQIKQLESVGVKFPLSDEQLQGMQQMLAHYDLDRKPQILNNKPVLFWHGQKDGTVPFKLSHEFYVQQQQLGETATSEFLVAEKAGHAVTREGMLAVTKWLTHHLA